ncbi:MAG: hypothetical protein KAI24_00580 [Planctomycetes bacterium]|nr:hypothetical protein [Planctomycetota bacterium]
MSDQPEGRDAFVHALLQEELGADPRPAAADELVQRFGRGDGARAAARLQAADAPARGGWSTRRWTLAAAALAVVAVGATFADDWFGTATEPRSGDRAAQDPEGQKAPVVIESLEHFTRLVPTIRAVRLEVLRLHDSNLPFEVEVKGHPVGMTQHELEPFVAALDDDLRLLEPAAADWQNALAFELADGRVIEGAIYPYSGARLRVHVSGLQGDLGVGGAAARHLRELLDAGVFRSCYELGIATKEHPLREKQRDRKSLRLFQHEDAALSQLAEFSQLEQLDVSGLRNTLGEAGLRTIAKACPQLEELVLDGCRVPDAAMIRLADLTRLKRLSLRSARDFTGTGFAHLSNSQKHRDGPKVVDLSYCRSLTDDGMRAICRFDPEVLRLRGAGQELTRHGFRALEDTERLRELDLRSFAWNDKGMIPTVNALRRREGLTLLR